MKRVGGKLDNGKYVIGKIQKKMPTLSDFQEKIKKRNKCPKLADLLVQYLRGNSLGMFDCESKIFSNEEIICFDMSEIKDDFTKLYASFVILTWIWQKFVLKNKSKKKIIICDEAWLFLRFKESADFLVNVARRGRKYNTPLFIGSQYIEEILNSEEGKTIINICATRYVFKQSPGSVDSVVDFFNLSERNKKLFNNS